VVTLAVVGCVVAGVNVAGASEPSADVTVKALASNAWDQPSVNIVTGDTVTWDMNSGNSIPHNVKSQTGPAEDPNWADYDTPIQAQGTESYTFTQPGTYTYLCEVHPGTMTGTVTVTGAPATPTPTSTATATPTSTPTRTPMPTPTPTPVTPRATPAPDHSRDTPAPSAVASADRTAPAVTSVRLRAVRNGVRVRFRLSEPASVTVRVQRRGSRRVLRTARIQARAGTRTVTVRGSKLKRGRHVVSIEARDAAANRSSPARKSVRIRSAR
jgi:plastocyanin